ncbi:glutathione S-transferase [Ascodesmis nigricans]|uniref:Glutathione S-transferase n=1 Tax=Ascodesmis nigricans TaxID=341454 RepID=A0A4S2MHV6_9PEZI|nr:glutathione S-transferase [Ascodesmis nigricans]
MADQLVYWPGFPGRAEPIRLALEEAAAEYDDTPGGMDELMKYVTPEFVDPNGNTPPFAPPILKVGNHLLYQTTNILLFLGPKLGLIPDDELGLYQVNELALTAWDLSDEAHNTHHPIGVGLYYEDQKDAAAENAKQFRESRIPKFFGFFNRVLEQNKASNSDYLVGSSLTYADLVLWQVIDGLKFAFPKATERELGKLELLKAFYDRVKERPRIKEYLGSKRRQKYSNGLFRHYEELDQ